MSYCEICNQKFKNPNYATSKKHLDSKTHKQNAKRFRKSIRVTDSSKGKKLDIVSELVQLKNIVSMMDNRISNIEELLKLSKKSIVSKKNEIMYRENQIRNLEKDVINLINQQSHNQQIKGYFPIKNLRKIILKKFNISEQDFKDIILRLYRKQIIDLQPGGNPTDYHILSPTGKKFYYLITKT